MSTGFVEPVNGKGTNLRFEDAGTFSAKLSAWHLPRKYNWQPQIGLEIDWTRFTADVPEGQVISEVSNLNNSKSNIHAGSRAISVA